MANQLVFQNYSFDIINHNNQLWIKSSQLSAALGYKREDLVGRIYDRNSDEFTPSMTSTVNLTVSGNLQTETRIFSIRGAHLIAMFAKTEKAKQFRSWALDILDREIIRLNNEVAELNKLKYNDIRQDYDQYILNEAEWSGVKLQPRQKVLDAVDTLRLHYQAVDKIVGAVHDSDLIDFVPFSKLRLISNDPDEEVTMVKAIKDKSMERRMLAFIKKHEVGVTGAVIANRLRLKKSVFNKEISKLVKSGLVKELHTVNAGNGNPLIRYTA